MLTIERETLALEGVGGAGHPLTDSGVPATQECRSPFRFTGTLKRVVVGVDSAGRADPEDQFRAAFKSQ